MCIKELTEKVKASIGTSTHEERVKKLLAAKIIDESGYYHPKYFSAETVKKNKAENNPILL